MKSLLKEVINEIRPSKKEEKEVFKKTHIQSEFLKFFQHLD